jgi:hypothetical protein
MPGEPVRLSAEERSNLVAYLDGELTASEREILERKITQSPTVRHELQVLSRTWELLDHLPLPQAKPDFISHTLTEARIIDERGGSLLDQAGNVSRTILRLVALAASALLIAGLSYSAIRWLWPDPTARLARQLSIAEHLDEYLDVGSFEILKQIDESPTVHELAP